MSSLRERIGAPLNSRKRKAIVLASLRGRETLPPLNAVLPGVLSVEGAPNVEGVHESSSTEGETLFSETSSVGVSSEPCEEDSESNEPIEYALRPFPRRGGPPLFPAPRPVHQPDDKLLYYTMRILATQKSRADVLMDEDLHTVLDDGTPQGVTYTKDVRPYLNNLLDKYNLTQRAFCSNCNREMPSKSALCLQRTCSLFKKKVKRTSTRRRLELITMNVKPQIHLIMEHFIDRIVAVHGMIHNAQRDPQLTESDIRRLPRYVNNIESAQEYQQNNMTVLLCVGSDGFRPKRLSKSEFWPMYLRVDCLDRLDRDSYFNSVLSSMLFARKSPGIPITEAMTARLIEELHDLSVNPIQYADSQNTVWNIKFKLYSGIMDFAALKSFYKIPRWNSAFGCGKCIHPGNRMGRRMSWASLNRRYIRRTNASILRDAAAGINGLSEVTPSMEMITPEKFPTDALHVACEGLVKAIFKYLFEKGPFAEMNLSAADIVLIKEAISNVINSTYSTYVLAIEDRANITGSELQKLADLTFVLCAVQCTSLRTPAKCIATACLIGIWWLFRVLQRFQSISHPDIAVIKSLAEDVQFLFEELHPELASMKFHYFFEHSIRDELEDLGSLFAWTAAVFESWHRLFQIKEHQNTTNCFMDVVKRYVMRKEVYGLFAKAAIRSGDPLYLKLLDVVENEHQKRFPKLIDINVDMYIPLCSSVAVNSINRPEWQFFVNRYAGSRTFSSRLLIKGKVYSSEIFWKRTINSQQSYVYLEYLDARNVLIKTFGSIIVFASDSVTGASSVLIKVYDCFCPFGNISRCIRTSNQPNWRTALRVVDIVSRNNCFFLQSAGHSVMSLNSSAIKGQANLVEVGGNIYLSRVD